VTAFKVVIPARFASSRLPGKPLVPLAGRPMVLHVAERAAEAGAEEVIVATDDPRIAETVTRAGFAVGMTASHHPSGTDRIAEVVRRHGWPDDSVVVNLQGDEPLMPPSLIRQVAADLASHSRAVIATLATPILDRDILFDPHAVKVVRDAAGYACYFSRAPIPWHRDEFLRDTTRLPAGVDFLRHIGLYAYRAGFVQRFVDWPPAPLEAAESLEQLRALWHGEPIHVSIVAEPPGHGVDTPDDVRRVEQILLGQRG
jgi:3-deoxy-manno-octulosonate cytidylyltransferase (CMP-KDO synthetase)